MFLSNINKVSDFIWCNLQYVFSLRSCYTENRCFKFDETENLSLKHFGNFGHAKWFFVVHKPQYMICLQIVTPHVSKYSIEIILPIVARKEKIFFWKNILDNERKTIALMRLLKRIKLFAKFSREIVILRVRPGLPFRNRKMLFVNYLQGHKTW